MVKSLEKQFLKERLAQTTDKGRFACAFNLSYIFNYGKALGIIDICAYSHFYNKFHELDGCKMTLKEKKQFFDVLTKIMVSVERIKITEGVV
jgi:hypothetical protein